MEKKKSFVLYADFAETAHKLSNEDAGKLFKMILDHANGKDTTTDNLLLEIAFSPIKSQMDRDAEKWLKTREARSAAGKKGGRPSKQSKAKEAIALFDKQSKAKKAVTDTVTVTVNENVTENVISKESRKRSEIDFDQFWEAYPKKVGKQTARKAWSAKVNKSKPAIEAIIEAVNAAKESKQWSENSGRFIPNPTTWINRHGWDDETDTEKANSSYYDHSKVF